MKKKFAMMLYPNFSLQEVTCLTSALTIWFGESIDYIASKTRNTSARRDYESFPQKQRPR